jgi:HlyD family secretion protein
MPVLAIRLRRHARTLLTAALLAAGCAEPEADPALRLSGHVEATEVRIAPDVGGRVVEVGVAEGDRVHAGQLVARLETTDAELAMARARAERAQADAQLRLLLAGSRAEDIRQAESQVAAAEADVAVARAEAAAARTDLMRFELLVQRDSGTRKERDDAAARVDVATERVRAGERRVDAAREVVARLEAGPRSQEVETARARLAAADAQIATLQEALDDATVTAPADGVVTQRLIEPGEVIARAAPIAVLTDLDRAWATVYVDEPMVPRVTLGQRATVYTDAGGPGIPGTVSYVSPQAEFTPRTVQTAEERSKLVYRLKIQVDNRAGVLKPGMPVEAELDLPPLPLASPGPAPGGGAP